jgi:hypothetical protein
MFDIRQYFGMLDFRKDTGKITATQALILLLVRGASFHQ